MKKIVILGMALYTALFGCAQERYFYTGPALNLTASQYTSERVGVLQGEKKLSYQGMDCWGENIVSLQNKGVATIYKYDGFTLSKIETFKLGCYSEKNHSNVASFSNQFFAKGDKLPLLFVSQAYKDPVDGMKDLIYIERINNNFKSSKLVAKINFKDVNKLFGYALQWVVDRESNFLYGFGNTIENLDPNNKHRIVKFKLPTISSKSKNVQTITLTEKDILENYLIEDYFPHYYKQVGQGLMIKYGYLYMPIGLGTTEHPSILYVWDLAKRKMQNTIDLSKATNGEFEDCAEFMGELLIQTQGELYKLRFQ